MPPSSCNRCRCETSPGVRCERVVRAINAVGLYVPAGSAPLPSAVIMLAVPARLAGCPQRVLCTPPARDGGAHPAVLVAAQLCGIDTVFKVGGAQAIAALAYGSQTIPKVDKIFGPGNAWVTAAKQQVAADPDGAAVDMPAGPSEVLVIADDSARAGLRGRGSAGAGRTRSAVPGHSAHAPAPSWPARCWPKWQRQMAALSRHAILVQSIAASRCIVVPDLADRHPGLQRLCAGASAAADPPAARRLECRSAMPARFSWATGRPSRMGDYCSGTNHVLPTYGYARAYSGLSLLDFSKRITVQELTPEGLRDLGPVAATLAHLEGLDAHAAAVECRLAALEERP